jgi:N-acetylglutamate synthase-like GNAT family acetyltransferase
MAARGEAAVLIERQTTLAASDFEDLVRDSTEAGYRFVRRLVAEWGAGDNRFDQEGEALFVARHEGRLVGVCGLNRDPFAPGRTGRVRHLYVLGHMRRSGIGAALLSRVIEHARGPFRALHLRAADDSAARFFEARGFVRTPNVESCSHVMEMGPPS